MKNDMSMGSPSNQPKRSIRARTGAITGSVSDGILLFEREPAEDRPAEHQKLERDQKDPHRSRQHIRNLNQVSPLLRGEYRP